MPNQQTGNDHQQYRQTGDRPAPVARSGGLGCKPQGVAQRNDELRDIVVPALVRQLQRIAPRERLQILRQAFGIGHDCAVHQHRDDAHVGASQGGGKFQSGVIIGVVQPALAGIALNRDPSRTDHRQQHAAGFQRLVDRVDEIRPRLDGLNVAEHGGLGKMLLEAVGQPSCGALAVLAAVADEDAVHVGSFRR